MAYVHDCKQIQLVHYYRYLISHSFEDISLKLYFIMPEGYVIPKVISGTELRQKTVVH